jgi:hypothetical protein
MVLAGVPLPPKEHAEGQALVPWLVRTAILEELLPHGQLPASIAAAPRELTCRLSVDAEGIIVLDRRPQAVDGDAERQLDAAGFLAALIEARGKWRSSKELAAANGALAGIRLDRVRRDLPPPVRDLVESSTKKGYRLVTTAWS